MTTPYTLTGTTDEVFDRGETVQVLVGSNIRINSVLSHMSSFVNAKLAWQVKKLYLGVSSLP
jgi:hypothetical protein